MDSKWIQGRIEEYSFYRLAKQILPESEFPVLSYPFAKESLMSSKMESMREKMIPQFLYITKKRSRQFLMEHGMKIQITSMKL